MTEPTTKLPDFDDMITLADEIGQSKTQLMLDKTELEKLKAIITEKVTTKPEYYIGNKPPSMTYIKSNYHVLGINTKTKDKLSVLLVAIANNEGELKRKELLFDVFRAMIDVWRTRSANKRGAYYEG
jgi:hypothetical protein